MPKAQDAQLTIEMWPVDRPQPYEKNPRIAPDVAIAKVARSLKEFGWRQPIVVDSEGLILVGHTRLLAAKKLGLEHVPVHVAAGLTPAQAKAYRLADNRSAQETSWEYELLNLELDELAGLDYDLSLTGFDSDELAGLRIPKGRGEAEEVDPVEPPAEPTSKLGDLWLLGRHRLLCGDSTDATAMDRLMASQRGTAAFTDPPWNVAIGQDSNPRHRQRAGLENDDLSPEDFAKFLGDFARNLERHLDGDLYCVLGASEWPTLDLALRGAGFHWSATIIWVKDVFVLGRSKYHRRYEPLWYGWPDKGTSSFGERRDLDDVWEIPRPKVSAEHPTMKPIELVSRAITNSSRHGDLIVDPFGGSGTTLLAAEQLGRRCNMMELDPGYCDVIVERYRLLTGQEAELEST